MESSLSSSRTPLVETEEETSTENRRGAWERLMGFVLLRDEEDEKEDRDPVAFLDLFRYATRGEKFTILVGILVASIAGLLAPANSMTGGKVVSIYVGTKDPTGNVEFLHRVWMMSLIYCAIGITNFTLGSIEYLTLTMVAQRITGRIRRKYVASAIAQDREFFSKTTSGSLSNQLNNNIDRIQDGLGDKIGLFARTVFTFVSTIAIAFYINWKLALLMFWCGPVCALTTCIASNFASPKTKAWMKIGEEANSMAEECITNVKTVASCNGQETMIERYSAILHRGVSTAVKLGSINGFFDGFNQFANYAFWIAGLWYGTVAYHSGLIAEAGDVLIVINSVFGSTYVMAVLGPHMMAVLKARISAAIVYDVIDRKPTIDSRSENGCDPASSDGSITFNSVHFSYPSRDSAVLRGLSFVVREKETIALVGKSGCGKSTTVSLISRLFDASQGCILLGDRPIRDYNVSKLRKMIGVVPQEPCLFNGTIRENIQLGRDLNDLEVEAAAKIANAHEFIMNLEKGYDTLLGPSGISLSGGQKQRIAIARAIAANPRILLLDEATSALDTHSERVVQAALNRASSGRTTIVIAHRLSTIRDVDRVLVVDEGRVIEEGGYAELSQRADGIFASMVALQGVDDARRRASRSDEPSDSSDEDASQEAQTVRRSVSVQEDEHSGVAQEFPSVQGGVWDLVNLDPKKVAVQVSMGWLRGLELVILIPGWQFLFRSLALDDYESTMKWTMAAMTFIGVYTSLVIWLNRIVCAWCSESVLLKLRLSCFSSLLHRPMAYFDRAETSTAASSIALSQQPPLAAPAIDTQASSLHENSFSAVFTVVLCVYYCWQEAVLCLVSVTIFISIFYFIQSACQRASEKYDKLDTSGELALEMFENVRTIQLLSVEDTFIAKYTNRQADAVGALRKRTLLRGLVHSVSNSYTLFADSMATVLGAYLVFLGTISVEQLYTSEVCVSTVNWAAVLMAPSFNDLIASTTAAKALFALVDPDAKSIHEGRKPVLHGSVKAERVDFAYPSRPSKLVSRDLNFSVAAGRSLALVGPSGGGKSTIVNLIERFYEPSRGNIKVDDIPLPSLSLHHLRSNVALVSQEPILFNSTIEENVALGVADCSLDDVRWACDMANAAEFIHDFPLAYDTVVGEKGGSLSGGQKQRIAIARALVRRPKIIVLDEATSALDSHSEQVVKAALSRSAEGRTSIVIAHRLDSIRHCDEICYVGGGRIVERGSHEALMATPGKYSALVEEQKLS